MHYRFPVVKKRKGGGLYKFEIPVKRRASCMVATMEALGVIRTVLVGPTHPGNVGGVARALKNMGLSQLYLVNPCDHQSAEATARAADAADVLAGAVVSADLEDAIAACHFVIGTTARARRIEWPTLDPGQGAARVLEEAARGPVAMVFGPERSGLTNAELDRCHALVHIPTSPVYPSLNLVSAVQILAYEIYRAATVSGSTAALPDPPATLEDVEYFYAHLEATLIKIGFLDPANPRLLMRRLRRLFNRVQLDQNELNILRGILTGVDQALEKSSRNADTTPKR
jgi:tRNA (cytidine32/uridine32-2'-O)-methyltransferase